MVAHPNRIDILPALIGGDSLGRRSMSRTEEDIASGVDITIMRDTTLSTYPASYSEVCDTFRPRIAFAKRTDSGRERFIDEVAGARLPVEQPGQGFDAVPIDQQHRRTLM